MIMRSLAGRRIVVTRALEDAERWAARLASLGATPVVLPCLVCEAVDDVRTVTALHDALEGACWLAVSSPHGAAFTGALLGTALRAGVRVAAVGEATADAASRHLGRIDLVATESTSAGLGRELARVLRDEDGAAAGKVVVAGAEGGRKDVEQTLRGAGFPAVRVNVYRTIPAPPSRTKRDLESDRIDDVLLASPSAVTGLLNTATVPAAARVITIGPTTSAAARAAGLRVTAQAGRPNLEGMLEVMS